MDKIRHVGRVAVEDEARKLLIELNATPRLKAFNYVVEGVWLILEDRDRLLHMVGTLYPAMGSAAGANWRQVERATRTLVDHIWDTARLDTLERCFGQCTEKPANADFLAILAYRVLQRLDSDARDNDPKGRTG